MFCNVYPNATARPIDEYTHTAMISANNAPSAIALNVSIVYAPFNGSVMTHYIFTESQRWLIDSSIIRAYEALSSHHV